MNRLRIEQMILSIAAPLIFAAGIKHLIIAVLLGESTVMVSKGLNSHFLETNSANSGRRPGEILVHEFRVQAHGFKNLRSTIRLNRRYTHFGQYFHNGLSRRFNIILHSLLMRDSTQQALANHIIQTFEGQIRIYCTYAIAEQKRIMMNLTWFAGFQQDTHFSPCSLQDQMVMQAGHGKQCRNRRILTVYTAVGQYKNVMSLGHDTVSGLVHAFKCEPHAFSTKLSREQNWNRHRFEACTADMADLSKILIGKNWRIQRNLSTAFRFRFQQVALRSDSRSCRRNQFFADCIDWRIGYLSKHLFEVIIEPLRPIRQYSQRRIIAHRDYRFRTR